ncbi:TetR/AcrR family transcriptional regulator [Streptomyces sp. NBC_00989]|uniref:TetR/AcrR family transcriptional regulator n=1 Tax=Streptomyces sp. NBC_00989 TaxID=2903705 RepID=UPI00386A9A25|nr:TetR/AcrR family transcriptional regulator [Streptomyces sp. NBC_00989]
MSGVEERQEEQATVSGTPERRRYRSTLRDERAADTRNRIIDAARTLFREHGFAGTTVAVIAKQAGVAAPTVYAVFCNKAEIIKELVRRLEAEADGEQWRARIGAEPDPRRKLDLYAAWHRLLFSRGRDVLGAAIDAGGDPAVRELREEGDRSNQTWLDPVVDALMEAGLLAPGLTRQDAVDRMMLLSSVELYFRATAGRGWTDDQYQQWLTESLRQQLLAQPPATTPDPR